MSEIRVLRWVSETQRRRSKDLLARAFEDWTLAWSGESPAITVNPIDDCIEYDVSPATVWHCPLVPGAQMRVSGLDTALLATLCGDLQHVDAHPMGPIGRILVNEAASDLVRRAYATFLPGKTAQALDDWPSTTRQPYAGCLRFCITLAGAKVDVVLGPELVAATGSPKAPPAPLEPIASQHLRSLASRTPIRGVVTVGTATVSVSSLLAAEPGDVVMLENSIQEPVQLEFQTLSLCLPAFLARTPDALAVEVSSPQKKQSHG